MSFRYTNNLVGALKHRLMLESSYRDIARRQFVGYCQGVEVICSGFGSVLNIRLSNKTEWEPFYRKGKKKSLTDNNNNNNNNNTESEMGPLDLEKLSESIKAALWDATRKIRAAKESALHRSLSHNPQLQSKGNLKHWYEEDANTLRPLAFEALKHEAATPWMQLVQFGKHQEAAEVLEKELYNNNNNNNNNSSNELTKVKDSENNEEKTCTIVLNAKDSDPASIPIGSVHPLFVPALIQFENSKQNCVDNHAIRQEQWRELSRDEQIFWERVELIRKGQIASIKGVHKRDYADMADVANDTAEDKVQLRFTQ